MTQTQTAVAPESNMPYWWILAVLAMVVFVAGLVSNPYLPDWGSLAPATAIALGLLLGTFNKLEKWRTFDGVRPHDSDALGCYFPLVVLILGSLAMGLACHSVRGGILFFLGIVICWPFVILIDSVPAD